MKKILFVILIFTCFLALTGCNSVKKNQDESGPYFTGKVIEAYGQSCLVEVTDVGNGSFAIGGEVIVNMNISVCPKYTVGDYIKISFDGKVAYSLPPQVLNVFSITVTDKSGN